jgi:hypothetical protein
MGDINPIGSFNKAQPSSQIRPSQIAKEDIMKKAQMMLILTLFLLATIGNVFGEEMAKEGTVSGTVSYNCPVNVMMMGKDVQYTFDALGVYVTDSADSPFNNASVRILGSGQVLKGANTEVGSMCLTLPNGDQVFTVYEGTGVGEGKMKGTFTFTGGTGNFAGITGQGEIDRFNVAKPAMKGTVQGYTKNKFTWKIEKAE